MEGKNKMSITATFAQSTQLGGNRLKNVESKLVGTLEDLANVPSAHDIEETFKVCKTIESTNASSIDMFRTLLANKMLLNVKQDPTLIEKIQTERENTDWHETEYEDSINLTVSVLKEEDTVLETTINGESVTFYALTEDRHYILVKYDTYYELWESEQFQEETYERTEHINEHLLMAMKTYENRQFDRLRG